MGNDGAVFSEFLAREFAPYAALSADQIALLEAHYTLLVQWNARLNLTRIDSIEDAVRLHYCESLFVGTQLPSGQLNIVDVGSGAGFPGIPIAILRPECILTLVESHRRKGVFLQESSRSLTNVKVVTDRAENLEPEFDWLVSRAVAAGEILKLQLASNLALLTGEERLPGFGDTIRIPWGNSRYLMFHVKQPC